MAVLLTEEEIEARLASVPGWSREGNSISLARKLSGFSGAMLFAAAAGHLAERANHHPDILVQWDTVTLTLSTHSAGGLTESDFDLASQINQLP